MHLPVLSLQPSKSRSRPALDTSQLAVIGAVFLISILLAIRATRSGQPQLFFRDPLFLLLPALAVVVGLLRWPQVGLAAMIVAGLAVPFELGTGTTTRLNAAILLLILLLGLWVFETIVQKRRLSILPSRPLLPLILFTGAAFLAFFVGQLPWFEFADHASLAAQAGGLALFFLAAGAFLLVAIQVRQMRLLEWMVWIYLALGAVHVTGQLIPGLGRYEELVIQRGAFNNSIFWIWLAVLSFSQAVFNTHLSKVTRTALSLLFLGTFVVAIGRDSAWTSGWLPPAVAVLTIVIISGSRWSWLALVGGAGVAAMKVQRITGLLFGGDNTYSLMTRVEAWRIIAQIVKVNPLLGLGPANYYWYTPLIPILGYSVQFNSHNNYVDLVAQVGLLGLVCFLWFGAELWVVGWQLRSWVPEGFPRAYVLGALGGLAGTLVAGMFGDWFLPFIYNIGFRGFRASVLGWMFLGGLVAVQQMLRATQADPAAAVEEQGALPPETGVLEETA